MEKHHNGFLICIFINIILAACLQGLYYPYINELINIVLFQFMIIPVVFVLFNTITMFKWKLTIYHFAMSTFCGFMSSIIVYAYTLFIVDKPAELPPGEIVLGADLVLIMFVTILQFIFIIILSIISILVSKYIFHQKPVMFPIQEKAHSNI